MTFITAVITTIPGREKLLDRAIKSVQSQVLQPAELIVIDDPKPGSDNRYVCARISEARNHALSMCKTPWIAYLDDDNWWEPEHLLRLWTGTWAAPGFHELVWSSSFQEPMDDTGSCWFQLNGPDPNASIIHADALRDVGGWETEWEPTEEGPGWRAPQTGYWYEDLDLFSRMMSVGMSLHGINGATWHYEMGDRPDPRYGGGRTLRPVGF
jgi:glycosyltransferase involved in cell wall biosynthesis